MADKYWVNGSGNWNQTTHWSLTSGGSPGAPIPNATDIVHLDANSGIVTITITLGAVCGELDIVGFSGTLGTSGQALSVYGALNIDASFIWNYTGTISLLGAGDYTCNIGSGAIINSPIIINGGNTSSYNFNGVINSSKAVTLTSGIITFNDTIQCSSFVSNTSQSVTAYSIVATGVCTLNNGTINVTIPTPYAIACTTLTISNYANFTANGPLYISNLITGVGTVCVFNSYLTITSNTLNSSFGGSSLNFYDTVSLGNNRTLTQTSGNTVFNGDASYLQNCYILTINGGTFTHNSSFGLTLVNNFNLNNATFNVLTITCKAIAVSIGTMNVNYTFANAINATSCTITNYGTINNLGGSLFTGSLTITGYFYSGLYVDMFTSTATLVLNDGIFSTDYGIYSTGPAGFYSITINNGTFTWGNPSLNILDIYSTALSYNFTLVQGTANINTNIKTARFSSDNVNPRALNLRKGITWEITGSDSAANNLGYVTWSWNIKTGNYIPYLDLSGTTIKFTNRNSSSYTIVTFGAGYDGLNHQRYGTIWFNRIDIINPNYSVNGINRVMGVAEFDNLIDGTPEPVTNPGLYDIVAHELHFESIDYFIFHDFNVNGGINTRAGAYRIKLRSATSTTTPFYFQWVGVGIKNCYSLNIYAGQAIPYEGYPNATDENTWFAYNSLDNNGGTPNCVGWVFILERFWVIGGNSLWSNISNWSYISGGPSGFSVPNNKTNVIFDANSGNAGVVITSGATCYDLNAQNFMGDFYNNGSTNYDLTINNNATFGDLSLVNQNWQGSIIMLCANKTVYLNCGNYQIANRIQIQDGGNLQGTVRLSNNLNTTKNIYIYKGNFNTSDGTTSYDITCNAMTTYRSSGFYFPVQIYLNSSTINLIGFSQFAGGGDKFCWSMYSSPSNYTTLDAGSSTIKIQNSANDDISFDTNDYAATYNNVWVDRGTSIGKTTFAVRANNLTIGELRDTTISTHSLLFDPGFDYYFSIFNVNGSAGNIITINRSSGATQIPFNITAPVYLNYVDVRNNNGNPDNTWYVNPANSSLTNTTQWYFGTPPVTGGLKKLALLGVG